MRTTHRVVQVKGMEHACCSTIVYANSSLICTYNIEPSNMVNSHSLLHTCTNLPLNTFKGMNIHGIEVYKHGHTYLIMHEVRCMGIAYSYFDISSRHITVRLNCKVYKKSISINKCFLFYAFPLHISVMNKHISLDVCEQGCI